MLKEYSISNILDLPTQYIPYYAGTFEETEDPEIEWPHRHAFYSLVWFTQGQGFYVVDFQEYEIKPNRIFFVSPKQVHNWDYSENSKGYILMCDPILGSELDLGQTLPYININEHTSLENIFVNLIREQEIKDELSDKNIQVAISYLYSRLRRLADKEDTNHYQPHPTMDNLKQLILSDNNFTTIEEYANNLQLSEESLSSICKASTGVSVKQYILDFKITEAKRLLIYSKLNVNEISYQLGFEDSSYFSRIFKKKTQLTPSDFLKKYRKVR